MSGDRGWLLWRLAALFCALAAIGDFCREFLRVWQHVLETGLAATGYMVFSGLWIAVAIWGLVQFRQRRWFWAWLAVTGWNALGVVGMYFFVKFVIAMS